MHDALALQRPKNFRQRRWNVGIVNYVETGGGDTRRGVCVSATDETISTLSFVVKSIAKEFLRIFCSYIQCLVAVKVPMLMVEQKK